MQVSTAQQRQSLVVRRVDPFIHSHFQLVTTHIDFATHQQWNNQSIDTRRVVNSSALQLDVSFTTK